MDTATVVLSLFMACSTIADTETSFAAFRRGRIELNPVMRPFTGEKWHMYAVKGSVNIGVGVLSHKLRKSPKKHERVIGWALPLLSIGVQSLAAERASR